MTSHPEPPTGSVDPMDTSCIVQIVSAHGRADPGGQDDAAVVVIPPSCVAATDVDIALKPGRTVWNESERQIVICYYEQTASGNTLGEARSLIALHGDKLQAGHRIPKKIQDFVRSNRTEYCYGLKTEAGILNTAVTQISGDEEESCSPGQSGEEISMSHTAQSEVGSLHSDHVKQISRGEEESPGHSGEEISMLHTAAADLQEENSAIESGDEISMAQEEPAVALLEVSSNDNQPPDSDTTSEHDH